MNHQPEPIYDLFISYAEADRAWVEGYLLDALTQAGVRCHTEMAFELGVPRLLEFERAVQQSRRTLLVVSTAYQAEGFGQLADLLAQSYGLETATWPVIPLVLEPAPLPPRLAILTALDASDPATRAQAIAQLCATLQRPVPGPAPRPACPYPGMAPFGEDDSARFFGRDREIQELLERLRLHRFLAVIGPSGSGKSSLVFAGLVPALRKSTLFGPGAWSVKTMRPGETPLATLQTVVGADGRPPVGADSRPPLPVNLQPADQPPATCDLRLLIVDQFEELFTHAAQDAAAFQEALLRLVQTPNCYVVITVRADFYPELMAAPLWGEIQAHRVEVLPLDADGLRQAIVRPAEDVGVYVEAALVERLVGDAAGEPGVLPLVQETLVLLWERLERRFLPLRAYEALVLPLSAYQRRPGVKCTGLQVALARRADAALAELTPVQQAIARRIFLRLIQFGEGRADTRRQQPVAALRSSADPSGEFDQTLEHLARSRLLTLTGEEGRGDSLAAHAVYPGPLGRARAGFPVAQRKADIAHEALIAGWPTLQGWLTERREAEQTRRRLEGKVVEWTRLSKIPVRGGRSAGGLLDAVELREATRWLASPDAADLGYDAALPTLIQVSGRALRQAFWLRAGSLAAAIIIIIAAIAIYAFQQRAAAQREATLRQQVEEQLAISRSRQVAAVARNRLDEGAAQQALLLGIAATQQITETAESANVLREALDAWRGEAVLEGHAKRVSHVAFSPNGQYLASISDDQTARLWQMSGDRRALVLRGHTADLTAVLFSADSRWLITAGRDSTARVWDVTSGETTHILNHGGAVTSLALSPDGQTVAAGDEDNAIWLWDLASGQPARAEPFRAEGAIQDVTFSPNGIFLVAASADNTAWLWHLPSGQFVRLTGFPAAVRKVAFSPDGRYLAACGGDLVQMWDMDGLKAVELKSPQHAAQIHGLAFSPDNRHLATASQDATVRLWDLRRLDIDPLILRGHTEAVWSVLFSPDGRILATMGWDDRVRLWRVGDGALETLLVGHTAEIWDSAFSPDGQLPQRGATLLATPDSAGVVRLWRAQAGGDVARHAARGQPTTALALVGTQVAVAGDDGIVELWRPDTDATQVYTATSGRLEALAASPDATLLATGGVDGQITLLDVGDPRQGAATGTALTRWPAHTAAVRSLLFLPDGVHLASAGADRTIRLWDLRKPGASQPVRELRGHTNDVTALAAGPTPGDLVSAGGDGTVRVWDWQTGQLQTQFDAGQPLLAVAVSPDRRYLAAGGYGAAVYVWSLATPGAEPVLLSHGTPVRALAFSPDGRRLGSGAEDGALRLWDLTNPRPGQPVVVRGHGDRWVVGLAFSADGRTLFSAGGDGQTHAWPAPTADALALGCRRAGRNLTLAEWQTYLAFTPFVKVCPEEAAASWTLGPRLDQPRPASAAAGPASLPLTADPRPIIRYFEALPGSTLPAAGSVTLRWDVAGAAALYLEYDGQRRGVTAPHEESFTPAADTVYRLIAINAAGERALEIKVVVAH